jgi:dTDP-4-dehydrorhamnose 3,5-epimerase
MGWKICYSYSQGDYNMIFTETKLTGAFVIEIEKKEDIRGFFARIWDKNEFSKMGLETKFIQSSISYNKKTGTLRGMHFQNKPNEENKIVRCLKGKIFDVVIDLRPNSKTFANTFTIELNEENYNMLYIPKGFAHGFQTLEDNTEVFYDISEEYKPESLGGIRWNDPYFKIKWPIEPTVISERDLMFKLFQDKL